MFPLLIAFLSTPAQAKPVTLTVEVVQADETPIPNALVVFPVEGDRHRVNAMNGQWSNKQLYLPDGTEQPFQKKDSLTLRVGSAGYYTAQATAVLDAKFNTLTLVLTPLAFPALPCLPEGLSLIPADGDAVAEWAQSPRPEIDAACRVAAHAMGTYLVWMSREAHHIAKPTDESTLSMEGARRAAHTTALDWLAVAESGDRRLALALCESTDDHLAPCE